MNKRWKPVTSSAVLDIELAPGRSINRVTKCRLFIQAGGTSQETADEKQDSDRQKTGQMSPFIKPSQAVLESKRMEQKPMCSCKKKQLSEACHEWLGSVWRERMQDCSCKMSGTYEGSMLEPPEQALIGLPLSCPGIQPPFPNRTHIMFSFKLECHREVPYSLFWDMSHPFQLYCPHSRDPEFCVEDPSSDHKVTVTEYGNMLLANNTVSSHWWTALIFALFFQGYISPEGAWHPYPDRMSQVGGEDRLQPSSWHLLIFETDHLFIWTRSPVLCSFWTNDTKVIQKKKKKITVLLNRQESLFRFWFMPDDHLNIGRKGKLTYKI